MLELYINLEVLTDYNAFMKGIKHKSCYIPGGGWVVLSVSDNGRGQNQKQQGEGVLQLKSP